MANAASADWRWPMFDYGTLKALAKSIKRPVADLLALAPANDPFYAAVGYRGQSAEWFAGIWSRYGARGAHLRRLHYRLVSTTADARILLPNGREYRNTESDWTFLCAASLAARYLDLVPFDGLIDRRNDEAMIFADDTSHDDPVSCEVTFDKTDLDPPEMPSLPELAIEGFEAGQDFIVEVWIEKSTQNDWLVPLCQRRGINLVVGIGEQSETRSRELALRASRYGVPVRIIYISDFDPAGRSMPKAVARKVEFTIARFDLDVDLQLIPLALTSDQCRAYNLPRTPIKESERRKNKFEMTFGIGATELDALEALYPGELARLLNTEIDNYLDAGLPERVRLARHEWELPLRRFEYDQRNEHAEEIEDLEIRFASIVEALEEWQESADELWQTLAKDLEEQRPDLSDVKIPCSHASGETDSLVLFDSRRSYIEQMDVYNAWRDGEEA